MNRPSRTDEPFKGDGYNQSPNPFSNDLTTNKDLDSIANIRELRQENTKPLQGGQPPGNDDDGSNANSTGEKKPTLPLTNIDSDIGQPLGKEASQVNASSPLPSHSPSLVHDGGSTGESRGLPTPVRRCTDAIRKFGSFIGPGFLIAVAYSKTPFPSSRFMLTPHPSIANTHHLVKLILGTMPQMLRLEHPIASSCCSSFSWLIYSPSSSRALLLSLALSVDSILLKPAALFSHDG
jgi:hypothetical protein